MQNIPTSTLGGLGRNDNDMKDLLNFFHGDILVNFTESINTFIKNNLVGSGGGAPCDFFNGECIHDGANGWGGGYIELFSPNGQINIYGNLKANGGNTRDKRNNIGMGGGAGSGGTIILEGATINILLDNNSVIEANGGNGKCISIVYCRTFQT